MKSKIIENGFSLRALILGLIGLLLVSWGASYIELRLPFTPSLISTHLPVAPVCLILLLGVAWNLLVRRFEYLSLNSREMVVILGIMLVSCFPPNAGLYRHFQRQLTLPWYYLASGGQQEWDKYRVLDYIPPKLFPSPAPTTTDNIVTMDAKVYSGIFQGLGRGNDGIPFRDVPWRAWLKPLSYWGPLIALMSLALIALSFLVHRQWAVHEQLSYPLAQVMGTMVARKGKSGMPDLFRTRLFWWGAGTIFTLYLLEYLNQWFPTSVPGLKTLLPNLKSWSVPLVRLFPNFQQSDGVWYLSSQAVSFTVIGVAYFVASEISLTMGLSQLILVVVAATIATTTGITLTSRNDFGLVRGGAYIAYGLVLLYTGRTYYWATFRNLMRRLPSNPDQRLPVQAARLLALATIGFVAMLILMGLDWFIAILFAALILLLFLVFTRIICETGVPFMQAHWWPAPLLATLLGPAAVGAQPLVLIGFFGSVLAQDLRESLMPYVATGVKLADDAKVSLSKLMSTLTVAVALALVVGFVAVTWTQYSFGSIGEHGYAARTVPTDIFNQSARKIAEINETGLLEASNLATGLSKLKLVNVDGADLSLIVAGAIAVFIFFLLRFRFTRFPLHPVLFLVWGVYATSTVWFSFLLGWLLKTLVVKFGGGKVYHSMRPLFIGLIAGELTIMGVAIVVSLIYYLITGMPPGIQFKVLPG